VHNVCLKKMVLKSVTLRPSVNFAFPAFGDVEICVAADSEVVAGGVVLVEGAELGGEAAWGCVVAVAEGEGVADEADADVWSEDLGCGGEVVVEFWRDALKGYWSLGFWRRTVRNAILWEI
jgi:hypothetical protein